MRSNKHYISNLCGKMGNSKFLTFSPFHAFPLLSLCLFAFLLMLSSCAKMGQPDGGWYDETPPRVLGASPADRGVNVKAKKVNIYFDEFVKIDNPTENVIVSPPQLEAPEIKGEGKKIVVELKDSLKKNTTYTVDFSDAISDNNENNPLGNFTYSFSTGGVIDTMEVSGNVLEAQDLEPVKGILVGLYSNLSDTIFRKAPLLRVARTDSRGHFVIKGVAPGKYRVYALQDADGDYKFTQKSEKIAFNHDIVVPSFKPDTRQDTIWRDSLHIDSIMRVPYTHYLPDDIVLRAFTEVQTDRYLMKNERPQANHFLLKFSYGSKELPKIKGMNFNENKAFAIESNAKRDSIIYWLRDTALVNKDTLKLQLQYEMTDSTGALKMQTDTLEILSKEPYARRLKQQQKVIDEWQKKQDKAKKKGDKYETVMPKEALKMDINVPSQLDPDKNITFTSPTPLAVVDTSKIHLYAKHDTLWYKAPFLFRLLKDPHEVNTSPNVKDSLPLHRNFELVGEWRPDIEYSLEIDSAAFMDIYGLVASGMKQGFKVTSNDQYGTLLMTINGMEGQNIVAQLLDGSDKVVKEATTKTGVAEFFYIKEGVYYLRIFVDRNGNGIWDTGDYDKDLQPEDVYYYPLEINCKAKWDVTESWDPKARGLANQKPAKITKQKADKQKKVKLQNVNRAKKLGIQYIPNKI